MQRGVKPQDRQAPTSVARFPTANTQYDLHQALASWNIDPGAREKYAQNVPVAPVEPTQPKAEGRAGLMGGLLNIVGKVAANPVGKVVGKVLDTAILKPLLIADTGRRAVISGIREGVDAFDGDDTTKASWGDFARQAKDFNTGFGNTFTLPEGKWRGRIIGFLGDVLLDPLTYATLGGTVAKKAIVKSLSAGGKDVLTRSILGKTMHGAKGRQALGDLAYDRLKHFQKIGTKLDGKKITDSMIGQITKDVVYQGKRKLPGLVADDIGLRGPGLYYFGSRVKVVGTEPIGWLLDKGLTGVRTGLVKPRSIKIGGQLRQVSPTAAIHAATVATGHGRVAQFGPDGIYHARMKLANGTATAAEAPYLLETVRAFEFSRGKVSGAIENAANMFENDVYKSGTEPFHKTVYSLLEGVRSRALASPEELAFVDRLRYAFNFLSDITDGEFKKVDSGWVKRHTNDYFPRIRTQAFTEWAEANPQVANQFNLQNLTVDQLDQYRLAKSAKGRQLDVGEPWFGSYLTAKDLNIDSLNAIARSKTGGIDVFETDIRVVTAAYSRRYGEHLGMASMMQHMKKRGPEFLAEWNKAIPSTLTGVTPHVGGPQTKLQNIKKNLAAQSKPKPKPKATPKPVVSTKSKITVAAEDAKVQIDETRTMVDASVQGHKEFVSLADEFTSDLANEDGLGTAHVMFGATEKHLSDSVDTLVEQQALLDSMSDDALAHVNGQVDEQLARMATLLEAHRQKLEYASNRLADIEDVSDVLPKPRDVIGTTMTSRNMDEPVKVVQQARVRGVDALQTLDDLELYLKELNPFGKMSPSVIAFQSGMSQDGKRITKFLGQLIVASDKATGRTRSLLDESVRNPKTPMGKLFARQKAIDINTTFGAFNYWMGLNDIIFRFKMENDITKLSANGFHAGAYLKQYDLAFEHNSRELLHDLYREQQNIIQQIRELPADTLVSETFVKTASPDTFTNALNVADLRKRIDLDTEFVAELLQETGGVPTQRTEELLKTIERRKKMVSSMLKGRNRKTTVLAERVYKPDFRKHYLETYLSKIEDRISSFTDTVNNHPVKVEPVTLPSTGPSVVEELVAQSASSTTPQGKLSVLKAKVAVAKEARRIARAAAAVEATKNFPPKVIRAFNDFRKTVQSRMLYLEQHGKALHRSARTAEDIIYAIEKRVEAMKEFKSVGQVVDVSEGFVTEQGDRMVVSNAVTDLADAVGYEDPEAIVYMNKVAEMRRKEGAALAKIDYLQVTQPELHIQKFREIGLKYNEEDIPFGPDGITIRSVREEVARLDEQAAIVLREASNLSDRLEHRLMQTFVDSFQGSQLINDWVLSGESMVPGISAKAEISRAIDVLDFAEKEFISGPDAPAQQIINEMMDNDYYPFAKSIERHLNVMHELSDFDMSKFTFSDGMPVNASFEQWVTDWSVAVDDLKKKSPLTTLTGGLMDWLKNPETARIVLSPDDFKQFAGDGMSDESLIQRFGDWVYRTQPQTLRSEAERAALRIAVTEAWEASDARPFLNQIKVLKEDVLQATRSRRSARALDLADSYLMNADTLEARRADALANIVPWTAKDKAAWNKAQKSFYGSGVNIKESIRELAEGKVVGTGEVRLSDASMKRVDTVLQAVAEGKLKVPGFFKMMAKRRLSTQPMTVEELIPLIGREANGNIVDKETGDLLYQGFENLDDEAVSTLDIADIATSVDTQGALELSPTASNRLAVPNEDGLGRFVAEDFTLPEYSVLDAANAADTVSTDSTMIADDVASGEMGTMSVKDLELQTIVNYINGIEDGTMNLLIKRNSDIEYLVSVLNSPIETKSIDQLRHERTWIEDYIKRQSTIKNDREYARIELAVERRLFESNGYNPVGALNLRESRLRFLTGKGMVTKQEVTARRRAIAVALAESRKAAKVEATAVAGAAKRAAKEAARIKSFPLHVREVFDVFSTMEDTLKSLVLDNDDKAVYWGLYGDSFGDRKAILNNVQRGQIEQWLNQLTERREFFLKSLGKTKFANSDEFQEFADGVKKLASWAQTIENRLAQVPSTDSFGKLAVTKGRPDVSDYGWSKKLVSMYNVQGDLLPDYPEFTSRWKPATKDTYIYSSTQMYVPPVDDIPEVLPHRFGPRDPDGMTLDLTAGTVAPVKQVAEVKLVLTSKVDSKYPVGFIPRPTVGTDLDMMKKYPGLNMTVKPGLGRTNMAAMPENMRRPLTVSFTGHRPNDLPGGWAGGEARDPIRNSIRRLLDVLDGVAAEKKVVGITGGALGIDADAAAILMERKSPFVLALPFSDMGNNWSNGADLAFLNSSKDAADAVVNVGGLNYASAGRRAYQLRNEFMADYSDVVIAVWSGKKSGGTWNALQNALATGKPIIRINPFDASITLHSQGSASDELWRGLQDTLDGVSARQGEVTPQQLADGGSFVPEKVIIEPATGGVSVPTTVSKTRVGDVAGVDEVYIGRKFGGYDSSKWHNPFTVAKTKGATVAEKTAAHQEAVDAYRTYLLANPELLKDLPELRGKKLLCWCDPLPCHGNVLKELLEQADNAGGVLASEVVPVTAIPAPPIPMEATQVARGYSPIGMSTQPSVDDLVYTMAQMKKVKPDLTLQQVKEFTIAYRVFQEALDSGQPLTPDNLIKLAHTNAALESLRLTVGMTPEAVDDALIKGAMSAIDNSMPPIAPEGFDPVTGEITDFSTFRGMDDEAISTLGPAPVAPVATPPRIGPPRPAGLSITPTPVRPVKARRPIVPSTRKPVGVTPTPMPTPRVSGPKGPPPPRVRGGAPAAAFGPGKIPPRTPRQVMAQGMIEMEGMFPNLWMNPVIHEMWENAASFEVPKYAKHLKDTIGQFTTFHKIYSTATPGFHVRNGLANMVQLLVAGVNPKNMSEATKIYYGWVLARRQGTSYGDYLSTLTSAVQRQQASIARNALHLSGGGIFTESFHTTYKGGKLTDNPVTSKLLTLGRESDDYSRFVMGYDSAQKGYGGTPAAARIQRWFFDYEDISKLDMAMKEIVPFWLWTSRNLTLHLQNVWLDPRPYQVYNHFVRNFRADEGHPPPFVDEIGGWKLPFGNNLYATPDVNFNRVPQQVAEIKSGTRYLQNLNPVFRVPLEQALGRNLYNDKEMDGAQQRLIHILQGFVPPVKYADRLINTEGEQQQNALLSFLGSPIKQYGGG